MMDPAIDPKGLQGRRPLWAHFVGWTAAWPALVSLALMCITLGIAVASVEQADWISPQPSLLSVLGLSILTAALLGRIPAPAAVRFCLMVLCLGAVAAWQVYPMLPTLELRPWINGVSGTVSSVWGVLSNPDSSPSHVSFALFLIVLTWIVGYTSTWFVLRRRNAWPAVTAGAIALLCNLSQLTEEAYAYFPIYCFAAILLLLSVRLTSLTGRSGKRDRRRYPVWRMALFTGLVVLLAGVVVTSAWFMPEVRANHLRVLTADKVPSLGGLFSGVMQKQHTLASEFLETLPFARVTEDAEDIRFVITSSKQLPYWRMRRYDIYRPWGWLSGPTAQSSVGQGTPLPAQEALPAGERIVYSVVNKVKTDVLLSAGQFESSNVKVVLSYGGENLEPSEVVAVSSPYLLNYGEEYEMMSRVASVTPEELSRAGRDYPEWISSRYLQLPAGFSRRVSRTSRAITLSAGNDYEKAEAVREYLSRFPYSRAGYTPPAGVDGVEHFLFSRRAGNCGNFASAMVVMLRSAGVPARLATGYIARDWDDSGATVTIRAKNYHAWPEVYFPGYGWIEFEATPFPESEGNGSGGTQSPDEADGSEDGDYEETATDAAATDDPLDPWFLEDSYEEELGDGVSTVLPSRLPAWLLPLIGGGGLFLLVVRAMLQRRRGVGRDAVSRVYGRMCLIASQAGLPVRAQETPIEYGDRLSRAFPQQAEAIATITQTYARVRFSRDRQLTDQDRSRLRLCWTELRRLLVRRALRARLLFGY